MQWGKRGAASVLFGGQFGSEGKGLAAAWLAENITGMVHVATTNAGAQAGHTTCYRDPIRSGLGEKFICYHLPTTGVVHRRFTLSYVNAGSIIDPHKFLQELSDTCVARIAVHPNAAVIHPDDVEAEKNGSSVSKIGSTQKGVGAAITNKVMRRQRLARDEPLLQPFLRRVDLNEELRSWRSVVVEVPQGFDLSINHGFAYPYCTSRDCWIGSGLSDAGIHPSFLGETCAVVRTYPIRVGHIYDEFGNQVGDSGPFWPDSKELDWQRDFPDIEPERTTVTKRVRRIATWSDSQYETMLGMNRPSIVFLNFCNYLRDADHFLMQLKRMERAEFAVGLPVEKVFGFGPCVEDVTHFESVALNWYKNRRF